MMRTPGRGGRARQLVSESDQRARGANAGTHFRLLRTNVSAWGGHMIKQRMLEALIGLLVGTLSGVTAGAIGLGLVSALIGREFMLFFFGCMAGGILGATY